MFVLTVSAYWGGGSFLGCPCNESPTILESILGKRFLETPKYPIFEVSDPNDHQRHGFLEPKTSRLSTWTLCATTAECFECFQLRRTRPLSK